MNFTDLIKSKLNFIFSKHNFMIAEERTNYIRLESISLAITISYDKYDNENNVWIGEKNNPYKMVEVSSSDILKLFFNSDIELTSVSPETFVNNLEMFFENEARFILMGDLNKMRKLYELRMELSKKYQQELVARPMLKDADKEWEKSNYMEFIKIIDLIQMQILPSDYKIKYDIAKQK